MFVIHQNSFVAQNEVKNYQLVEDKGEFKLIGESIDGKKDHCHAKTNSLAELAEQLKNSNPHDLASYNYFATWIERLLALI